MERQYCASAFTIENNKVLLMYNKKLNKWLQPGGHIEGFELPNETAIRETLEETGIHIEIVLTGSKINKIPVPIYVENYINKVGDMVDFQYCAKKISGNLNNNESNEVGFFSIEELDEMNVDQEIKVKVKELIKLFK